MTWRGVIEEYRDRLPLGPDVSPVTLQEGNTALIEAPRLAEALGFGGRLLLKHEGLNPTASFKDRGMTVAISAAVANGAEAVICASTGNTSASAAAYAARAGIRALVIVPEGKIALGKLSQAVIHGATVVSLAGDFDAALRIVRQLADRCGLVVVNSINPYRIQGQKTAAFEICDVIGRAPDYHFLPVGNAGNITAYWMGYCEYAAAGIIDGRPQMMGFQAAGADPIVRGAVVDRPETVATAIRIGNPASWRRAAAARDESGGSIESVTDRQILEAYRLLAATEGVFAEPASAAAVAGLRETCRCGFISDSATVVCTLTGHGLKDPATATDESPPPLTAHASVGDVMGKLQL
jgi:threonine synthase